LLICPTSKMHASHTQFARRATVPQHAWIALTPKSVAFFRLFRTHKRGASRSSRVLGAGCDGRDGRGERQAQSLRKTTETLADGEVVWSWPPDAEAKLAMMLCITPMTVARKPGHRGEREGNR
jgi:hypothetical protein